MAIIQLEKITSQYRKFVSDQVLTAEQLNEIINYFEDQNRLTRICLSGVGIVCGLFVSFDLKSNSITVSSGGGITTDGDLLKFKVTTFTHYKVLDKKKAEYSKFSGLTLYELTTASSAGNIGSLRTLAGWNNMIALLYLENYAESPTNCSSNDCNNLGEKQIANLKVLLISQQHAQILSRFDSDPVFAKHDKTKDFIELPEINIQRVILQNRYKTSSSGEQVISGKSNTTDYLTLMKSYFNVFTETGVIEKLKIGFFSLIKDFKILLQTETIGIDEIKLNNLFESRFMNVENHIPIDYQYRYDLLKDLTDTYNEIREYLFELAFVCCPEVSSFPKHLILGEVQKTTKYYKFRHKFYPSQAVSNGFDTWCRIRSLMKLFYLLFEEYSIPNPKKADIKITPSVNYGNKLSNRAIPYYYKTSADLVQHWDFQKTKMYADKKNIGYHTSQLLPIDPILYPFKFNIDKNDFFRIEGHLGKNYIWALEEINNLRAECSLPFDVKVLSIGLPDVELNPDDYVCEFGDLKVMLDAIKAEQGNTLAMVSNFFSGFSISEVGTNIKSSPTIGKKKASESIEGIVINRNAESLVELSKSRTLTGSTVFEVQPQKIVAENIATEDGTLGNIIASAFEKNKEGSVNDIIAGAKKLIDANISSDVWSDQSKKETFINNSAEVLAHAYVFERTSPSTLADLQDEKINIYNTNVESLCNLVKKLKTSYQKIELSDKLRSQSTLLINQLANICSISKKVKVIKDEIEKRKKLILLNMQLSKFVEANPGLEHKAGCGPGDTFFMIYLAHDLSLSTSKSVVTFDVNESFKDTFGRITANSGFAIDFEKRDPGLLKKLLPEIANLYLKEKEILAKTVIADFTLPYICCSKCMNINYVFPKEPTYLKLDKNRVCLGNELVTIAFEVSPDNSNIKTSETITGLEIENSNILIDPELFDDKWIDKPIDFKVDGELMDEELLVGRIPQANFVVPKKPTTKTTFTFKPKGKYLEEATYYWNFGDNSFSEEKEPTHIFDISKLTDRKATITLNVTAKNGICKSKIQHTIQFIEEIKIDLPKDDVCADFENPLYFKVYPDYAKPEIKGPGVQKDTNGFYVFITALAGVGIHQFKVNGETSDCKITVHVKPEALFDAYQEGNYLVFENKSNGASSYIWEIDGQIVSEVESPNPIEIKPNSPSQIKIRLTAKTKNCKDVSKIKTVDITYIPLIITISLPKKNYCDNLNKPIEFIIKPADVKPKIKGDGVEIINGKSVFYPSKAGVGKHSFTVNGNPSDFEVTVHKSPTALFEAFQKGNFLVLENHSTDANSYVWEINGQIVSEAKSPDKIEIKPNSPSPANIVLTVKAGNCKSVFKTSVDIKYVPETSCVDSTTAVIVSDGKKLKEAKTGFRTNNFLINEIFEPTLKIYNSTLNNTNEFLSGNLNNELRNLVKVMGTTAMYISEWQGQFDNPVYKSLVQICILQIHLFFNVLCCQPEAQIKVDNQLISELIGKIIALINNLRLIEVELNKNDSMQNFLTGVTEKSESPTLNRFINKVSNLFE